MTPEEANPTNLKMHMMMTLMMTLTMTFMMHMMTIMPVQTATLLMRYCISKACCVCIENVHSKKFMYNAYD